MSRHEALSIKLSDAPQRQVLCNPQAARLWCRWNNIGKIEDLYNMIADDPSIISRIDRFAKGLKALKPGLVA